jgi:hypothetical protein
MLKLAIWKCKRGTMCQEAVSRPRVLAGKRGDYGPTIGKMERCKCLQAGEKSMISQKGDLLEIRAETSKQFHDTKPGLPILGCYSPIPGSTECRGYLTHTKNKFNKGVFDAFLGLVQSKKPPKSLILNYSEKCP